MHRSEIDRKLDAIQALLTEAQRIHNTMPDMVQWTVDSFTGCKMAHSLSENIEACGLARHMLTQDKSGLNTSLKLIGVSA